MLKRLLPAVPVLVFAGTLAALQWVSGMPVTSLALKTVAVFLVTAAAVRLLPWDRWLLRAKPGSRIYTLALLALFVRHFAGILTAESRRMLTARSLAAPFRCGPWSFRSLSFAVAAVFSRSFDRAERFYAAQRLRGIAG